MNPGIYGAVASIYNQRRNVNNYKKEYTSHITNCVDKKSAKIIWNTHMDDLKRKGNNLIQQINLLQQYYRNNDYLYIMLFKYIQEYNQEPHEIENYVCYGDDDFGLYEKQIYEKLKKKFEN